MFVDACAMIAVLSGEAEGERISQVLSEAPSPTTSPLAVIEAAIALARPDKFGVPLELAGRIVLEFVEESAIIIADLPPARELTPLLLDAASRYRTGRTKLNLADCVHYACAKHGGMPILATHDEFRQTDLPTVP